MTSVDLIFYGASCAAALVTVLPIIRERDRLRGEATQLRGDLRSARQEIADYGYWRKLQDELIERQWTDSAEIGRWRQRAQVAEGEIDRLVALIGRGLAAIGEPASAPVPSREAGS